MPQFLVTLDTVFGIRSIHRWDFTSSLAIEKGSLEHSQRTLQTLLQQTELQQTEIFINMNSFSAIISSCILIFFFTNIITIVALEATKVKSRKVAKSAFFQSTSAPPPDDKCTVTIFASFAYCDDERGGEDCESQHDVLGHTPDLVSGQNRRRLQNDEGCSSNNCFVDERLNITWKMEKSFKRMVLVPLAKNGTNLPQFYSFLAQCPSWVS